MVVIVSMYPYFCEQSMNISISPILVLLNETKTAIIVQNTTFHFDNHIPFWIYGQLLH